MPEYGIPFPREWLRATFGRNNAGALAMLVGPDANSRLVAEIGDHKEEAFRQAARGPVQTLPGARCWLQRLMVAGFRQAIATSAPQQNSSIQADGLGLLGFSRPTYPVPICPPNPIPARLSSP